jgi:hypothetical protein
MYRFVGEACVGHHAERCVKHERANVVVL